MVNGPQFWKDRSLVFLGKKTGPDRSLVVLQKLKFLTNYDFFVETKIETDILLKWISTSTISFPFMERKGIP